MYIRGIIPRNSTELDEADLIAVRGPKPPRRKILLWNRADVQRNNDNLNKIANSIEGETDVNQV